MAESAALADVQRFVMAHYGARYPTAALPVPAVQEIGRTADQVRELVAQADRSSPVYWVAGSPATL